LRKTKEMKVVLRQQKEALEPPVKKGEVSMAGAASIIILHSAGPMKVRARIIAIAPVSVLL